jgi:hypothetical protein
MTWQGRTPNRELAAGTPSLALGEAVNTSLEARVGHSSRTHTLAAKNPATTPGAGVNRCQNDDYGRLDYTLPVAG